MPGRHAKKRVWPWALAVLALALVTSACGEAVWPTPEPPATSRPAGMPTPAFERVEAEVVEVVDGDTIHVEIDGTVYAVRYIGIDCPETTHPYEPVEWMGLAETRQGRREL